MYQHDPRFVYGMDWVDWDEDKRRRNVIVLKRPKPDVVLKEYWRDPVHFADLINAFFYHGRKVVLPEDLLEMDSVVLAAGETRSAEGVPDVVRYWTRLGSSGRINRWIFFVENQMYLDSGMEFRVSSDRALITSQESKKLRDAYRKSEERKGHHAPYLSSIAPGDRIPGISGLVIYYGGEHWTAPTRRTELIIEEENPPEAEDKRDINIFEAATQRLPFQDPDNKALFEVIRMRFSKLPVVEKSKKIKKLLVKAPKAARDTYLRIWGSNAMRDALAGNEGDDTVLSLLERDYEEIRSMSETIKDQSSKLKDQSSKLKDQSSKLKDQSSKLKDQSSKLKDQSSKLKDQSIEIKSLKTVQLDYARMLLSQGIPVAAVAEKTRMSPEEIEKL